MSKTGGERGKFAIRVATHLLARHEIVMIHPTTAFKILTAGQWAQFQADGIFQGAPVDIADGYIHLSAIDELQGTLDKHFAGQSRLVIAEVDLAALGDLVRWEVSRGGAHFPHIYGALPMSAVTSSREA